MELRRLIKLPLIITGVLIFSAFVPVLQVFVLVLNAGFLYPFEMITNVEPSFIQPVVNAIFSVLLLTLYYFSSRMIARILTSVGFVFFTLPVLIYPIAEKLSEEGPYFLQFIVVGIMTGAILLIITYLKTKIAK